MGNEGSCSNCKEPKRDCRRKINNIYKIADFVQEIITLGKSEDSCYLNYEVDNRRNWEGLNSGYMEGYAEGHVNGCAERLGLSYAESQGLGYVKRDVVKNFVGLMSALSPSPPSPPLSPSRPLVGLNNFCGLSPDQLSFAKTAVLIVTEEEFEMKFTSTYYFELVKSTPRKPDIESVISDLNKLFEKNEDLVEKINHFYTEYKDKSHAKMLTLIWTHNTEFTRLLNAGLILDAVSVFGEDKFGKTEVFETIVEFYGMTYKEVLQLGIKFMRYLNTFIVDNATQYNTENRVVYRGIPASILGDVKQGETYRLITWHCTSEEEDTAKMFKTDTEEDSALIKFYVKEQCYNAGKINKFGKSTYPTEKETLIPPYSAVYLAQKKKVQTSDLLANSVDDVLSSKFNYDSAGKSTIFVLNLAQDNKNVNDDIKCNY